MCLLSGLLDLVWKIKIIVSFQQNYNRRTYSVVYIDIINTAGCSGIFCSPTVQVKRTTSFPRNWPQMLLKLKCSSGISTSSPWNAQVTNSVPSKYSAVCARPSVIFPSCMEGLRIFWNGISKQISQIRSG